MKTKYKINNNELIINLDFLDDFENKITTIREYINDIVISNKINFKGNRITVYKNGIFIGNFYLINYYLKKLNYYNKNNLLTNINSFFYENNYIEINYLYK